jgi:hypothetical protein
MCAQCMMGAATATAGATGIRSWLAARRPLGLSDVALRRATVVLLAAALFVSAVVLGGASTA